MNTVRREENKERTYNYFFYINCSITVLLVEEDSPDRDTAASEKVCPRLLSYKRLQRLDFEPSLTTYQFLDLSTPQAWDHAEIYRRSKDPERHTL